MNEMRVWGWWNDTERVKQKYPEKHLSQCHFAHYYCHMTWPGIEAGPPR